jgi:hypothetical protein
LVPGWKGRPLKIIDWTHWNCPERLRKRDEPGLVHGRPDAEESVSGVGVVSVSSAACFFAVPFFFSANRRGSESSTYESKRSMAARR